MTTSMESLKTQLGALSQAERADLAHFLLESLEDGEDADATATWETEVAQRIEEIRTGKAIGKPADEVFADLRTQYP